LINQSDTLSGRITAVASKPLVNEVFTKMKMDIVGKLAREDPLIVHLGNQWESVDAKKCREQIEKGFLHISNYEIGWTFAIEFKEIQAPTRSRYIQLS
jgi:hypothetical protein